jgi:hypothetical protein
LQGLRNLQHAAPAIDIGRRAQGDGGTEGMGQLPRQGERLLASQVVIDKF